MNIYLVLAILAVHFIADFVCQTDWQAKNKSGNFKALIEHTYSYTVVFLIAILLYLLCNIDYLDANVARWLLQFIIVTFVTHTAIDFVTSKINAKLWEQGRTHAFFVSVGFDQLLHYTQLLLTYYFLTK